MNNQRMEMERKLPPPSQLLCSHLWTKTNEAGIRLSQEDIVLLSRIFCDYIQNTKDGKRTVLKILNATTKQADSRHAYFPFGQAAAADTALKASELIRYSGWIYKGALGLSDAQLEVEPNGGLEACEATGILGPKDYCVQTVKDYSSGGREILINMSNYARSLSENPNIRETANISKCKSCPVRDCEYHQDREPKQLLLTAPGG